DGHLRTAIFKFQIFKLLSSRPSTHNLNMRSILLFLITLALFTACTQEKPSGTKSSIKPIDSLFKDYYTFKKRINPLEATKAGFNEYNAQVANYISTPYQKELIAFYSEFLNELKKYDSTMVTPAQQLSMSVMEWDCNIKLQGLKNKMVAIASPMFDM